MRIAILIHTPPTRQGKNMSAFVQRNPSLDQVNPIGADSRDGLLAAVRRMFGAWQQRRGAAQADRQLWLTALADPRVMAEITRAREQHQG